MAIVTSGLLAYWNSKQGVSATQWDDLSGNAKHLAITGTTQTELTKGVYFDGVDDKAVGSADIGVTGAAWTLEIGIYQKAITSGLKYLFTAKSGTATPGINIQNSTRDISFYDGGGQKLAGATAPLDPALCIITLVRDVSGTKFYVDGVAKNTGTTPLHEFLGIVSLGCVDGAAFWNGYIAFARVYNRALTTTEVTQNYQNGTAIGLTAGGTVGSVALATKQVINTTASTAYATKQTLFQTGSTAFATQQTITSGGVSGSVSYATKQAVYQVSSLAYATKQTIYRVASIAHAVRQIIYQIGSLAFATQQTITNGGIPGSAAYATKQVLFQASSVALATKQSIYQNASLAVATKQSIYQNGAITVATRQVIRQIGSFDAATKQVLYRTGSIPVATKQAIFQTGFLSIATLQRIVDGLLQIIDRIPLTAKRTLYVYLTGQRELTTPLRGDRQLTVPLRGEITVPAVQDLEIYIGESKIIPVTATDRGVPINLTGATVKYVIRRSLQTITNDISKQTGTGIVITDAVNGVCEITLDPADTRLLKPGHYYHEVQIIDSAGHANPVIVGDVTAVASAF